MKNLRWRWAREGDLVLLAYERDDDQTYEAALFTRHKADLWNERGLVGGWDGNVAEPTFSPSILVCDNEGNEVWHGFLKRGELVAA